MGLTPAFDRGARMRLQTAALTTASLVLGLAAGAFLVRPAMDACPANAKSMSRLELVFGTARRDGPPVSDEEWRTFLDDEITPRFPSGLSVLEANGQWRGDDGTLTRERSRMVLIWYEPTGKSSEAVEAIRAAYKARFGQDSVLRADDRTACVSF